MLVNISTKNHVFQILSGYFDPADTYLIKNDPQNAPGMLAIKIGIGISHKPSERNFPVKFLLGAMAVAILGMVPTSQSQAMDSFDDPIFIASTGIPGAHYLNFSDWTLKDPKSFEEKGYEIHEGQKAIQLLDAKEDLYG